jgi:hypothetical protein
MTLASRLVVKATLLLGGLLLWGMLSPLHAEGICPPGMFSTNPPGAQGPVSCAPIPNYAQNPGQAAALQVPQPPPARWADHYGAIATDEPRGAMGAATNMLSKISAENAAMSNCKEKGGVNCDIQIWYTNQCVALVVGGKIFNVNSGASVTEAAEKGMQMCKPVANDCHVYYSACSLPVRIQ